MTKSLAIFNRFSHQSTLFHHPACLFLKRKASSSGPVSPVGGLSRMCDRPPRYAFTCRYGRPGKPSSQSCSAAFHGGEKSFCSVARTTRRNTTFRLPSAGPKALRPPSSVLSPQSSVLLTLREVPRPDWTEPSCTSCSSWWKSHFKLATTKSTKEAR